MSLGKDTELCTSLLCMRQRGRNSICIGTEQQVVELTLVVGKDEIQENADHGGDDERGLDDEIDTLLEALQVHIRPAVVQNLVEPRRCDDVNESDPQGDGQDETVASVELHHAQNPDTRNHNGAVEKDLHAAKD